MLARVRRPGLLSTAALILALGTPGLSACSPARYDGPFGTLSIGATANESNALIYIAGDQGYFAAVGLAVTVKTYASGKAATDGMLAGEVDISTSSEYAFAGNVMAGHDVRLAAVINRFVGEYLVARTDSGIHALADLKGKKIGVPMKSRPEFALGRFLEISGINGKDIEMVNVPVDRSVEALVEGQVDAVATWQPYVDRIKDQLGGRTVAWSVQNAQPSCNGIVCTAEWARQHGDTLERLLKALAEAENFLAQHPDAARAILQEKLAYDNAYLPAVWPDYQFSLLLDTALVAAMEDEARWMIKSGLSPEKDVPDFVQYIYADALRAVKPEAVNIIW